MRARVLRWLSAVAFVLTVLGTVSVASATALDDFKAAHEADARGERDRAIVLYTRALDAQTLNAHFTALAYSARGTDYAARNDTARAFSDCDAAIRAEPGLTLPYVLRGGLQAKNGNLGGARADFDRAVELSPHDATVLVARAYMHIVARDYERASADLERAIAIDGDLADAYAARARVFSRLGRSGDAYADAAHAISLRPTAPAPYLARATVLFEDERYDDALADIDQASRLSAGALSVATARAQVYGALGDDERYLENLDRAIALEPSLDLYVARGVALTHLGRDDEAMRAYDRALTLRPDSAAAHRARGAHFFARGLFADAERDFAAARLEEPTSAYVALWLSLTRMKLRGADAASVVSPVTGVHADTWPAPIVALYGGSATPEGVLAAAASSDPRRAVVRRCEADFYVAEFTLWRGDRATAIGLLQEAAQICPPAYRERLAARAELSRLLP